MRLACLAPAEVCAYQTTLIQCRRGPSTAVVATCTCSYHCAGLSTVAGASCQQQFLAALEAKANGMLPTPFSPDCQADQPPSPGGTVPTNPPSSPATTDKTDEPVTGGPAVPEPVDTGVPFSSHSLRHIKAAEGGAASALPAAQNRATQPSIHQWYKSPQLAGQVGSVCAYAYNAYTDALAGCAKHTSSCMSGLHISYEYIVQAAVHGALHGRRTQCSIHI